MSVLNIRIKMHLVHNMFLWTPNKMHVPTQVASVRGEVLLRKCSDAVLWNFKASSVARFVFADPSLWEEKEICSCYCPIYIVQNCRYIWSYVSNPHSSAHLGKERYFLYAHCKKNPIYVFLSGNCAASVPIFTFITKCLWAIYIILGSVHLFPAPE